MVPLRWISAVALGLLIVLAAGEVAAEPAPPWRPLPASFLAPLSDPAGQRARALFEHFERVPNMRARSSKGRWLVDPAAAWSIRPERECLADLRRQGVPAVLLRHPLSKIPAPVVLYGPVDGVLFHEVHEGRPVILACEMAARLPALANIVQRFGVHTVDVLSSFRLEPDTSYHTVGLGLDITGFQRDEGALSVLEHFLETTEHRTCREPTPEEPRARALLEIACALANTHRFSTVITPNYRRGHRDHFHLDARPRDPRIFVR